MRCKNELPSIERYNAAFPSRLRYLMKERDVTQQELANAIGKSRPVVGSYANGVASPDLDTLVKIAQYFSVSTDYLLGESDANSRDVDLQSVCRYTQLSEEAIKEILELQRMESFLGNNCSVSMAHLLSKIIENPCFEPLMEDFQLYLDSIYKITMKPGQFLSAEDQKNIDDIRKRTGASFIVLPESHIPFFYRNNIEDFWRKLLDEISENYKNALLAAQKGGDDKNAVVPEKN